MNKMENLNKNHPQHYRKGLIILLILTVLTISEFMISMLGVDWLWIFVLIAMAKAFFVLRDYMHIGRLFTGDEVQ